MSYKVFAIIAICLVFLPSIISFILGLRCVPYAKAGKVNKFWFNFCLIYIGKYIKQDFDFSDYMICRVHGNSMRDYGVTSGHNICVAPFVDQVSKGQIKTYPILMIKIDQPKNVNRSKLLRFLSWMEHKIQSQYKLRKFVSYIEAGDQNWDNIYDSHSAKLINISKERFCSMMAHKGPVCERMVLSTTYNEQTMFYECSLHPVNNLFGIVKFVS